MGRNWGTASRVITAKADISAHLYLYLYLYLYLHLHLHLRTVAGRPQAIGC